MTFLETTLAGAYIIEPQDIADDRGFFARVFCSKELRAHGLRSEVAQANMAYSRQKGTLRGLHFQLPPHAEVKIIRCTKGSIYDVIVDLRPSSPTWKRWFGVELTQSNHRMLYVPEGFGQGYVTLEDDTEMCYNTSEFYHPEVASGVRYDDPAFKIVWPVDISVISMQDRRWPDYSTRKSMDQTLLKRG